MSEQASEFGVIGLTVAGQAIALRLAARGCRVSLWDASFATVEQFALDHIDTRGGLLGYEDLEDFFDSLALPPRAVFFLPAYSEAVARAAQLAGSGVRLIDGGSATAAPGDAALDEIEARLLAAPD
ncbi:MAG: NAD(P)-binding domain-containing protein [Bryobacteraceae bacterium]|jgi:6-phosphogluconate dehydrogenase